MRVQRHGTSLPAFVLTGLQDYLRCSRPDAFRRCLAVEDLLGTGGYRGRLCPLQTTGRVRMKAVLSGLAAVVILLGYGSPPTAAEEAPFLLPDEVVHQMKSKFVDQVFEIRVQLPARLADGSERFPVLYVTDSYGDVAFQGTNTMMQLGGDIPRMITVGIGYHDVHPVNALRVRTRDLTPVAGDSTIPDMAAMYRGLESAEISKTSGGAAEFLKFIVTELQPFIDEHYPTDPRDRGYFGDSLGGLFGLYVLFNQPEAFNRYIIGSPSVWWGNNAVLDDARAFLASGKPLNARVFLGVGALEAGIGFGMVSNTMVVDEMLRSARLKGLELTTQVFPGASHTSVIAINYVHGLQAVYDAPKSSLIQVALKAREPSERSASSGPHDR
jgi:hypothetical protein